MHRVITAIGGVILAGLLVAATLPAAAATSAPPVKCDPFKSQCDVRVRPPGSPGSPGGGGSGGPACRDGAHEVPCSLAGVGQWSNSMQCYLRLADPQPGQSDPVWGGHTTGAIYWCTTGPFDPSPVTRAVWLAAAPPGLPPSPEELAREALATLHLPAPVMRRSPTEANSDNGTPYTWVNLWTWFWTSPATWDALHAGVARGGVWAQVTVTPTVLTIDPGDGAATVSCAGPGRPWRESDGNAAPSAGGCGYRYAHVAATPLTATMTIQWSVTWTGSGGAAGTLPVMRTQAQASFMVEQIQVVNR